jgi:hypothetical protein
MTSHCQWWLGQRYPARQRSVADGIAHSCSRLYTLEDLLEGNPGSRRLSDTLLVVISLACVAS